MLEKDTVPLREVLVPHFQVSMEMVPMKWTTCKGRWAAEVQIASHMFQDPYMIEANYVLFSQDGFAECFWTLTAYLVPQGSWRVVYSLIYAECNLCHI